MMMRRRRRKVRVRTGKRKELGRGEEGGGKDEKRETELSRRWKERIIEGAINTEETAKNMGVIASLEKAYTCHFHTEQEKD